MHIVLGSGTYYYMAVPFALMAIPFIAVVGWIIWSASVRRGMWIGLTALALAAAFGVLLDPASIWAVTFGAVIVAVIALRYPPLENSWWSRHKAARAEGKRDAAYFVFPVLIGLGSVAPLVVLLVAWSMSEA